jgi:peptide/nickel transport system ATP-binding protein
MGLLARNGRVVDGSAAFWAGEDTQEKVDLLQLDEKQLDEIRGNRISMVFQDPLTSLNPVFTVGNQITESIRTHMKLSKAEAKERAVQILQKVGMPDAEAAMKKYPHTLSGGMRQRAMIAMALSCDPALLIADEPTTALDVTIQAQIMDLLLELKQDIGMSIILITHDIGLVANMADRVLVMYAGQIVEEAEVGELFQNPKHPYTKALLATVPSIYDKEDRVLEAIPGMVPENYGELQGCRFAGRCKYRCEQCETAQEDYVFALNILKKGYIAVNTNTVEALYRIVENSRSAQKLEMAKRQWKVLRDIEKLSFIKASYYFCHYAIKGVLKFIK